VSKLQSNTKAVISAGLKFAYRVDVSPFAESCVRRHTSLADMATLESLGCHCLLDKPSQSPLIVPTFSKSEYENLTNPVSPAEKCKGKY
jgi:hypothetical protein